MDISKPVGYKSPVAALADTHKIIWHGQFLDGTLTLLTDKGIDKDIAQCEVTFVVQGADDFNYVGQAVANNSTAGLENLLQTIEIGYKQAVAEDLQDLTENYGLKPN